MLKRIQLVPMIVAVATLSSVSSATAFVAPTALGSSKYTVKGTTIQLAAGRYDSREGKGYNRRVGRNNDLVNRQRWRGHRGSRDQRAGYRLHSDGWWYPLAASAITQAITKSEATSDATRHQAWCEGRYDTYRRSDDTYWSSNGNRKRCDSPFAN